MTLLNTPLYVDKKETAKAFSISLRTVERWIEHGCPHRKLGTSGIGKCTRLNLEKVDTWLTAQQKGEI
jgi:phage terminase Nu1 subunit (DNA packaging protein)